MKILASPDRAQQTLPRVFLVKAMLGGMTFLCLPRIPVPPKSFAQALVRKERPKEELRYLGHLAFYKYIVFPPLPFEIRGLQPTG